MRLRAAAAALVFAVSAPSGGGSGVRPPPAAPAAAAADAPLPVERGRDPLGLVRSDARPRVWVLFDTSTSMTIRIGRRTRHAVARETLEHAIRTLVSAAGEPLVHWRIASFRAYRWDWPPKPPMEAACADPTRGVGLPPGSPPGPAVWRDAPCAGMVLRTTAAGCDAAAARAEALEQLPPYPNADITPNGVGLRQLAAHIRNEAISDLEPGQQNIVLLLTDGMDTCECDDRVWRDPLAPPPERFSSWRASLRRGDRTPAPDPPRRARRYELSGMNAGLKAKAAFYDLNDGDPDAGIGDIYIIGFGSGRSFERGLTNHLAWMGSNLRRPAYHASRAESLAEALDEVLRAVTLPEGEVKVGAPRLATVKELVASGPTDAFAGTDPTRARDALVAPRAEPKKLAEVLRLRNGYADNVLLSTSADLGRLRGRLVARPVYGGASASAPSPTDGDAEPDDPGAPVIWDAGARLERRDPASRLILFHRAGETRLRRFEVGTVTAADLGVQYGFLRELDGHGARNAADAAEMAVRLIRGERVAVHPETDTIYGPDGRPHFTGGVGTWKLRESLASPVAAGSPPLHPDAAPRNRAAYRRFFERRVNRRTVAYLATGGGMLHAFAADTGEELFAFIPAEVLGPTAEERDRGVYHWHTGAGLGRVILRELAAGYATRAPDRQVGLVGRYTLAGSPVVRDVYLRETGEWATVLAFGRDFGGRFVTALDVSEVGGDWNGTHRVERPGAGGRGLPKLLFHLGNRVAVDDGAADGFGETPPPLLVETPAGAGGGSEWTAFAAGGAGSASDDSGEWLFEIAPGTGRIRRRHRLAAGEDPEIDKNGAPTAPAPWSPSWANPEASDLVTRLYLGDLHGQVHRLALDEAGRRLTVAHRLGGRRPIVTRPVAFPFPGRYEPHLLVVTGGDRRVAGEPAGLVLLRETSGRLEEVWRRDLPAGEAPQGNPAVRIGRGAVEVLLATTAAAAAEVTCGSTVTGVGVSRLRAFNGLTGAPAPGALGGSAAIEYGAGRIRGLSVSSSGNVALGVSQSGGGVFDTVIGDFRFKVSEGALTEITFFVEGLRRSPF